MLILMCGSDMTGKTNIARALSAELHIPVYKSVSEHTNFLSKQDKFVNELRFADPARLDLIEQTNLSVIFDRGHFCEYAYSRFYNRQTDHEMLNWVDKKFAQLRGVVIICVRESFEGISDDLDNRLNATALAQIQEYYLEFAKWTHCPTLILHVDDEDLDRELNEIREWLMTVSIQ